MRILVISDFNDPVLYEETNRNKIGNIDLVISCGDLSREHLSYVSTMYKAPLFFVRGNHDLLLLTEGPVGENLHDQLIKYRGIRMLGFEGVPNYNNQGVQFSNIDINILFFKFFIKTLFLERPDIIVTHAPPKGIHDGPDNAHRGVPEYAKMITQFKPKYFLHGHNHLDYHSNLKWRSKFHQITMVESTTVIRIYGYYILNY